MKMLEQKKKIMKMLAGKKCEKWKCWKGNKGGSDNV